MFHFSLVRLQKRIRKSVSSLDFFTTNEWRFHNDNVLMLHDKLSEDDREVVMCYLFLFKFGMKLFSTLIL